MQTPRARFGLKIFRQGRNKIAASRHGDDPAMTRGRTGDGARPLRFNLVLYFISPAAVSARVMICPTSTARRAGSRRDWGRRLSVVSGESTSLRSYAGLAAAVN